MSADEICGMVSESGRLGEPLACGFPKGHDGTHSWATLPTFVAGDPVEGLRWATPEDRALAERDARLYGNFFGKTGDDGLLHRIDPTTIHVSEAWQSGGGRIMRCPECGRVASVPDWCKRPICVHSWDGCSPEVWDGDDTDGQGRPIEESPNEDYRTSGPRTWTAMVPYA